MATKREQRKYQREWIAKRRQKWIKENGPCNKCGTWDNLEVDHIDPQDKVNHRVWSWSDERRKEELKKCQVLCEECHKTKSIKDQKRLGIGPFSDSFKPGTTVLEESDVREIKRRLNKGESQSSIAKDFPVTRHAITKINTGKRWADIEV